MRAGALNNINRGFWSAMIAALCTAATVMAFSLLSLTEHVSGWFFCALLPAFWIVAWHKLGEH